MPSQPIFYPLPFSALFLCSHSELCKFPSNQFIERSCTMHCTAKQKEKCKLRKSRKTFRAPFVGLQSTVQLLTCSWLWRDRGWRMEESPKKRLIYRPLAIAPHYFQRRTFFAHYHILLTFDIIGHTHTSTNNVKNLKN